jgi:hypothetical protein
MQEQERERQSLAEQLRQQREAELQAREEQRRRAAELASQAVAASSSHPTAAAAAAAYVPNLLARLQGVVYTPAPGDPFATQQAQPSVLNVPRPEGEVGMSSGSQAKRAVGGEGDGTSPKAKARSGEASSSGSQQAGTREEGSPKATIGAKKTISKAHQALRDGLKEELNQLNVDSIISRLKNGYSVDKASKDGSDKPEAVNKTNFTKSQLIELYVEASSKGNNLIKDKNKLEEERERSKAESLSTSRRARGGSQQPSERTRTVTKTGSAKRSSTRQPKGRGSGGSTGETV